MAKKHHGRTGYEVKDYIGMAELYNKGRKVRSIAKAYDTTTSTIHTIIYGLRSLRAPIRPRKDNTRPSTEHRVGIAKPSQNLMAAARILSLADIPMIESETRAGGWTYVPDIDTNEHRGFFSRVFHWLF